MHQTHHQSLHEGHEATRSTAHPAETSGTRIEIGIGERDRTEIAEGLARLLADTYTLYLKTHNCHWNVTGPMFRACTSCSRPSTPSSWTKDPPHPTE
jgi:starvation-inducible DNA-binding protein